MLGEDFKVIEDLTNSMVKSSLYVIDKGFVWAAKHGCKDYELDLNKTIKSVHEIDRLIEKAEKYGIRVMRRELEFITSVLLSKVKKDRGMLDLLRKHLIGKWMIFLPTMETVSLFKRIAESIDKSPAKGAKTPIRRENRKVVIIYTKNFLDIENVYEVLQWLKSLNAKGILYYKPDLFTQWGIYRGHKRYKPYIYYCNLSES